jgi:hypothetical protein
VYVVPVVIAKTDSAEAPPPDISPTTDERYPPPPPPLEAEPPPPATTTNSTEVTVGFTGVTELEACENPPCPIALVAAIVNVYAVPAVNPVNVYGLVDAVCEVVAGLDTTV